MVSSFDDPIIIENSFLRKSAFRDEILLTIYYVNRVYPSIFVFCPYVNQEILIYVLRDDMQNSVKHYLLKNNIIELYVTYCGIHNYKLTNKVLLEFL